MSSAGWTSPSTPLPEPTTKRERSSPRSASRSSTEERPHGQARTEAPRPETPQDGGEVQDPTRGAARDHLRRPRLRRSEGRGAHQAAEAAARLIPRAPAQSLRAYGTAAWGLSQVRPWPKQAARARAQGRSAR